MSNQTVVTTPNEDHVLSRLIEAAEDNEENIIARLEHLEIVLGRLDNIPRGSGEGAPASEAALPLLKRLEYTVASNRTAVARLDSIIEEFNKLI